jgi:hypothetical protein
MTSRLADTYHPLPGPCACGCEPERAELLIVSGRVMAVFGLLYGMAAFVLGVLAGRAW